MKGLRVTLFLLIATPVVLSAAMCSSCRRGTHGGYTDSSRQQHFNNRTFSNHDGVRSDYYTSSFDRRTLGDIRQRLDSRNPNWSNENVFIFVEYGKVVLNGKVDTEQEKREIEEIATGADGASVVVNKLDVRY